MQSDKKILEEGAEVLAEILLDIFLEAENTITMNSNRLEGVKDE